MARERRTDLTGGGASEGTPPGRKTTRKVSVTPGTEKNNPVRPTTGKATAIRQATGKVTPIRPATGKTGTIRPVTGSQAAYGGGGGNGKSMVKNLVLLALAAVLFCVAYKVFDNYQAKQREKEETRKAEAAKQEAERLAERKRSADEAAKRLAAIKMKEQEEQRIKLEEALAKKKADEEARSAKSDDAARLKAAAELAEKQKLAQAAKDLAAAQAAIDRALQLSAEGKFSEAVTLLERELNGRQLPEIECAKFERIAKNIDIFAKVVNEVEVSPEASAEGMYWITLKSGKKLRGKIESESGDEIVFVTGGAKTSYPKSQVKKREVVKQAELDGALREELAAQEKNAVEGVDWFMLGVTALKANQKDIAYRALNKSAEVDENIHINIIEHKARLLFNSGAYDRSIGNKKAAERKFEKLQELYPDSKAAKMAQAAVKQEEEAIAQLSKAKASSSAEKTETGSLLSEIAQAQEEIEEGSANLSKANTLAAQAETLMKKAQNADSSTDANGLRKEASKQLVQALAIYRECLKEKGSNAKQIEEKIQLTAARLFWCHKQTTL